MPALIAHHLFGEEAAAQLPGGILEGEEPRLAFLLGCQGPDPLFFRFSTLPRLVATERQLGSAMHQEDPLKTLAALRSAAGRLKSDDAALGRAFSLGFLAHYLLDSTAHPFVYAQVGTLMEANPDLAGAEGEVHAVVEADLDAWLLWSMRRLTVEQSPSAARLARTARIELVAGALMSQVAGAAFATPINAQEFGRAVADCELVMRAVDPAGSPLSRAVAHAERVMRPHSLLASLAHAATASEECPAANLEHAPWVDPATQAARSESFADLFHDALRRWPAAAEQFVRGDLEALGRTCGRVNFDGRPLES